MKYRLDITNPAEYVAVQYKGANFMCVKDSKRAKYLSEANVAWRLGYATTERELFDKACASAGCAFEHYNTHIMAESGDDHV